MQRRGAVVAVQHTSVTVTERKRSGRSVKKTTRSSRWKAACTLALGSVATRTVDSGISSTLMRSGKPDGASLGGVRLVRAKYPTRF